jgi:hypothetical protein
VKPPRPGRGRKKHDAPVKPDALHGANHGERLVAAIQGRFGPTPTTFAELLAGLVELGSRLPKGPLPGLANVHAIAIQQASDAELPNRIEALAGDLAATLRLVDDLKGIPTLLREVADVIESRPLQRHEKSGPIVLAPADPTTAAAASLLGVAARELLKGGRRDIDGAELLAHLRTMPVKARLAELRRLGADGDDRTIRRKHTALFPELRLAPGRPRKPDK